MIKWRRIEAGRYESEDKRFEINRIYSRAYQGSWVLIDRNSASKSAVYDGDTLLSCKVKAEDFR